MKKYYFAYDDRYRVLHEEGLLWFSDIPTPELIQWINYNSISSSNELCEVGCGEGRDALYLSDRNFKLTAIDASETAILKCREFSGKTGLNVDWKVADALFVGESVTKKFHWVYSIATLHMLVDDCDRNQFLTSLFGLLKPGGKLLLVNKGDGKQEVKTDSAHAFELRERVHSASGKKVMVAGTSYRAVTWDYHTKELENAGFFIEKAMNTKNHEYEGCMTVYLSRKA